MDFSLPQPHRDLQTRVREFCERVLQPLELTVEENGGLPEQLRPGVRDQVREAGLNAINHSREHGGSGYTLFEQNLINEQLGRATNGLWTTVWQPAVPLRHGSARQIEQYLVPPCAGERRGCYAITEPGAGSDARAVRTSAVRRDGRWVLNGEKWFVTSFNASDFLIVHAHVDGDADQPTLFLVDKNTPGVVHKRSPHFMHTYAFDHAEVLLEDVTVEEWQVLGEIGQGFELTKDWFVEARLQIAAHCVGAATRAAEVANAYAGERVQFGRAIRDFQAIEFMIAEMAVEIMASKSLLYRCAWEIDSGIDRKLVHARASALKLQCAEMANRVVDKAVQILGGRGYMRENPVERLYRDLRVDRIWEGTSEIQKVVIGAQIAKRGLDVYTGW